ncbi:hypothetical protein B7R22_05310 [Subtercola boreus]|uniref:Peptidase M15B domain-containing protein n=1 Tax=Subtercola boreus TaxID=120213 RepID=A0A3E0W101_9MICO|nr:hypothetical protein [Subtercola boreus]RFA15826.1 hypothetical protein B7R22_05310 [Subtercola boreus]
MAWVNWAKCENGEVPNSLTVVIGTFGQKELRLNPAAAAAFLAWDAEFFGRTGIHIRFSETGRDIATQDYLYDGWVNRRPGFFPAAKPKTSTHGEWTAGDVLSSVYSARMELHDILVETGHNHGWSWELVGEPSREPWHFNFIGDPLSLTVAQFNARHTQGEDDMSAQDVADIKTAVTAAAADTVQKLKPSATIAGRTADGGIAIFGADFVEDGIAEPARLGKRGRRIFRSADEYGTFKTICDTINANGGEAPVLPTFDKVVFLDENGWATFNSFYQEP